VHSGTFTVHSQRNVSFKCLLLCCHVYLESVQKYKILLALSPNHGMTYTSILMS